MRAIPINIENFNNMITNDFEYVDKTMFIEEILRAPVSVRLMLKPRRFGKTLMLSMLETYLSIQQKELHKDLFKNLAISKCDKTITSKQGTYPVINITFKELKAKTWKENYEDLKGLLSELYEKNIFLLDSLHEHDQKYFNRILNLEGSSTDIKQCILKLTRMLYNYYKKQVVILIDEYDMVYETCYINNCYNDCLGIINPLLGNALKTNEYLAFSVMTGILRISKESVLSELNHLDIYNTLDDKFSTLLGFTENEVLDLLKIHGYSNQKDNVAKWYNGYLFGENKIYNPWSILKYLSRNGEFSEYWVNTSSNRVLTKMIMGSNEDVFKTIQNLILGNSVEVTYMENLQYSELNSSSDTILSFLLSAGYLTKDSKKSDDKRKIFVRVPNYEVRTALETMITNIFT